ncbi:MAG: Uma2 family endonuclease [Thiolinea sp.]
MAASAHQLNNISVEEYLAGERISEIKHEYVDGQVFAMAGASRRHNLIGANILALLWIQLQGKPCYPISADMLLKTGGTKYRYPDLQIICDDEPSDDEYVNENPVLIVEVLSRSTRRLDKTEKRAEYLAIPSLQEYVLIEQDVAEIEVQRRSNDWHSEYYYLGQDVHFESVDVTLSVEAVYQRVDNEDVTAFLLAQQKAADGAENQSV